MSARVKSQHALAGHGAASQDGRYVVFDSQSDGLLATPSPFSQVFRLDRLTGIITLVSATPAGLPGGGDSDRATVSANGTRIAYRSAAQDLVAGTNDAEDVFLRDLSLPGPQSSLVSRASNLAGAPGNARSNAAQIAADGSAVLFTSAATNLHPDDADPDNSVFVRQLDGPFPPTVLFSRADGAAGASIAEPASANSISGDGQVVAFATQATALDPTATDDNGKTDIYARNAAGQTRLVTRSTAGTVSDGDAADATLSGDGSAAAFTSTATNLATGDGNGVADVFRRTGIFGLGATTLISLDAGETQSGNDASRRPAISADANVVGFVSSATNMLADPDANELPDVFARNVSAGTTTLLSHAAGGEPAQGVTSFFGLPAVAISRDGAIGAFSAEADTLSALDDDDFNGVYAAAVAGGPVSHLSQPPGLPGPFEGGVADDTFLSRDAVSRDGRYVVFVSESDGLSGEDDDRFLNAFVRDLLENRTTLVSRASGAGGAPANEDVTGAGISSDGSRVAFATAATNLSADDADATSDVFVRDVRSEVTTLVSRGHGPAGPAGDGDSFTGSLDADGSRVAFHSAATNLGPDGDADTDVFVRDLDAGTTLLASRADGAGGAAADAVATGGSLSADGTRVAFTTDAANLGDGDDDAIRDAHVRDLAAGRTFLASRADGADGAKGDGPSQDAVLSADGTRVGFTSNAANLGDGDTSAGGSVFVRDLAASTTRLASRLDGPAGDSAPALTSWARMSDDGSRVLFASQRGDLTGEAPANAAQVYLRDMAAGRTLLVSRGDGAAGAPLPVANQQRGPALSGNGLCVAFLGRADAGFVNEQYRTTDFFQAYLRAVGGECAPAPGPPPPPPPPLDGVPADTTAPLISQLAMLRRVFAVGARATPVNAARRGTAFLFTLSENATVRIAILRERAGRRKRGRCVKPTPALRRARRCTRLVRRGTLVRSGRLAGANRVPFSGRIGRRALPRGRYRSRLVAIDAAGNRSAARTVRFRVTRR